VRLTACPSVSAPAFEGDEAEGARRPAPAVMDVRHAVAVTILALDLVIALGFITAVALRVRVVLRRRQRQGLRAGLMFRTPLAFVKPRQDGGATGFGAHPVASRRTDAVSPLPLVPRQLP
jgi:hypothetical protein